MSIIEIKKANGAVEQFEPEKLFKSLIRSGASAEIAGAIVEKISKSIISGISSRDIYRKAFSELKKANNRSAVIYSLRKAVMELGPTGFPFEDFFAEILKTQGYITMLDQVVSGRIVPHEMDVVAYNDKKLIMVETKFHNDQGFKTDLKVALYVKARFDDLKETKFVYGKERSLDEGWLVTNTKFTSQALIYGTAQDIKMIGWNYPEKGNLQDLIEESGLHPLTCLTTLSNIQKRDLMSRGFVLCKEVLSEREALAPLGLPPKKLEIVLSEAKMVVGE